MSGFLDRLADRALGLAVGIEPLTLSQMADDPAESVSPDVLEAVEPKSAERKPAAPRRERAVVAEESKPLAPLVQPEAPLPTTATRSDDQPATGPAPSPGTTTPPAATNDERRPPRARHPDDSPPLDVALNYIETRPSHAGAEAAPSLPAPLEIPSISADPIRLPPSSPTPPTIEVKIGHLEVRAAEPADQGMPPARKRPRPSVSLEDYLRKRGSP